MTAVSMRPGMMLAVVNVGLGAALLLGGPRRHTSGAFAVPGQLLPIRVWGVLFLLAGAACAVAAVCLRRAGAVSVGLGAGLHAAWAAALAGSAVTDPTAALTGAVVYAWIALLHVLTAARLARQA